MHLPTVNIQRILYTTDLSDTSLHAFSYAVSLATLYGATITILHVMGEEDAMESYVASFLTDEQMQAIRERRSNAAREALIGKKRPSHTTLDPESSQGLETIKTDPSTLTFDKDEVLVVRGAPAEQIIKISNKYIFDLIVMGTHGTSLVKDMLGSVARRVTRQSKIPVLSVSLQE